MDCNVAQVGTQGGFKLEALQRPATAIALNENLYGPSSAAIRVAAAPLTNIVH